MTEAALWFGAIPERWTAKPSRDVFRQRTRRGEPTADMLSVTIASGVIPQSRYLQTSSAKKDQSNVDRSKYKFVERGDLVYNKMRAWQGAAGCSNYEGIVSPAYVVLRTNPEHDPRFYGYVLRTPLFAREAERWSYGITSDQWSLRPEHFKMIWFPAPTQNEQRLIVRYLDNAELRIARAIQAKERLAGLITERREAVVTANLRGNVTSVRLGLDSGIPGLGTLPEGWQLLPVKSVWKPVDVRSKTGQEERLTVSARSGIVPRSTKTVTMFEAATYVGHKVVEPDQLVINSLWAWAGGLGVSEHSGLVSPVYGVYGLKDPFGMNPAFFHALLRSNLMQWQFQVLSKGIWKSRLQLSDDAFLSMRIPVPPLAEQNAIARQIAEATSTMDAALEAIANEVGLLREYRTRLISDVVTGKKDVRADAARMKDVDSVELASVLAGVPASENDELVEGDDAE